MPSLIVTSQKSEKITAKTLKATNGVFVAGLFGITRMSLRRLTH
jgi:hypothetical protein